MVVVRISGSPIVRPDMDDRLGTSINGPSLIQAPDWLHRPLGKYYLYFAHHKGKFIRLAYADGIQGPYTVYAPGVLSIEETPFRNHIASPDVHVDDAAQRIIMHYHGSGCSEENDLPYSQPTCYAKSTDGLSFHSDRTYIGEAYLRTFYHRDWHYGFSGGPERRIWRSRDLRTRFQRGPVLQLGGEQFTDFSTFEKDDPNAPPIYRMRHICFHKRGYNLNIYYSNIGDLPERIKRTTVDIRNDWHEWRGAAFEEVIHSETDYEGVNEPLVRSCGGVAYHRVHEVRDPFVYEEDGKVYLFYSVAGEQGIGLAELPA